MTATPLASAPSASRPLVLTTFRIALAAVFLKRFASSDMHADLFFIPEQDAAVARRTA